MRALLLFTAFVLGSTAASQSASAQEIRSVDGPIATAALHGAGAQQPRSATLINYDYVQTNPSDPAPPIWHEVERAQLAEAPYNAILSTERKDRAGRRYACNIPLVQTHGQTRRIGIITKHCLFDDKRHLLKSISAFWQCVDQVCLRTFEARVYWVDPAEGPEHDLAVILLPEEVPENVKPFAIEKTPLPSKTTLVAIGYTGQLHDGERMIHVEKCESFDVPGHQRAAGLVRQDVLFTNCPLTKVGSGSMIGFKARDGHLGLIALHNGEILDSDGNPQSGKPWSWRTTNVEVKITPELVNVVESLETKLKSGKINK